MESRLMVRASFEFAASPPARTIAAGHAFVQNPCRGNFNIATAVRNRHRLRVAECCFASGGRDRIYFFGWGRGRR
jgi:hypothetical protein